MPANLKRITTQEIDQIVSLLSQYGRPIVLQHEGIDIAAIVPTATFALFEEWLNELEDEEDLAAYKASLDEPTIPYDQVRKELGLE